MRRPCLNIVLMLLPALLPGAHYDGNLRPEVRTSQEEINSGAVPYRTLFFRGAHIFSNAFTTRDGFGEAPDGPRRRKLGLASNPLTPFLRFNGLDAQSCQECHGIVGMKDFAGVRMIREPGALGGSGGFSANVFIFENPDDLREGLVRNPPHVFGLGYVQRLSDEMTAELLAQRDAMRAEASDTGRNVRRELRAKGLSFGFLNVGPTGGLDTSEVHGVSEDLVVRPFQFKGVASTIRNFVAGAMNFHFSVQPKELMDRHFIDDDNPSGMLKADSRDEIGEGEVSTVAIFAASLRPPMQDLAGLDAAAVSRGRALMDTMRCTDCHHPTMTIDDPRVTILDPRYVVFKARQKSAEFVSLKDADRPAWPMMTAPETRSELLAPVLEYEFAREKGSGDRPPGYTFDLNATDGIAETLPRLAARGDGSIEVPLFSDLRRHRMGAALADTVDQRSEMPSILVPRDQFVTRPLWGVADTGPWLHDGRATTLEEAILGHAGEGSEAAESVALFEAAGAADREALLTFLRSLRVRVLAPSEFSTTGFVVK